MALSGEGLFLVFPFDSSADASVFVDRIDPESAVVAIFFVRDCFGIEHLESGAGDRVSRRAMGSLVNAARVIVKTSGGRAGRIRYWLRAGRRV